MKAIITGVNFINSASVNVTVDITQNDGTPILTRTFGIVNTGSDSKTCLDYLKQSMLNVGNQYLTENKSKMFYVSDSLIGKVIQL